MKFLLSSQPEIWAYGDVKEGDELWMLDGTDLFFIFRRQGCLHKLVGKVSVIDSEYTLLEEKRVAMAANDASIQTIDIK